MDDLLSLGLTGAVTDDLGYYGDYRNPLQAFKNVIGEKKKFRAHLLRRSTVFHAIDGRQSEYNEPWIEPGDMKFFIDGALGGSTALLSKPYTDNPSTSGNAVLTDEEIDELVATARKYGRSYCDAYDWRRGSGESTGRHRTPPCARREARPADPCQCACGMI